MSAQEEKRLLIIEAAVRRFGHFGIGKTTMTEIANDLSMSKASLYYYFPDKTSLFVSSLEHIIRSTFTQVETTVQRYGSGEEAMLYLLDQRMEFLMEYYQLFEHFYGTGPTPPKELTTLVAATRDQQIGLFRQILYKGMEEGEFRNMDVDEVARMILYAMEGMRFSILRELEVLHFPTKDEFGEILRLQKKMISVLIDGLRPS